MSYWAKSSSYYPCQAHAQIFSFWFEALCQDWFKDFISNSNLFDIWYENDLNSIQCQANPQMSWAIVMSAPNRGDLQSYHWNWSNRITNHILYCVLTYLLVLFTAKPKYLNVSLADGRDITTEIIGPFNEGHELRLVCESGGGKPIPRVTWYNGSSVISGMSFHDLFFYTTCIEYSGWLDGGGRLTEYNKATTTVFWKYL